MKNQPISKLLSIVLSVMMIAAVFAPITAAADSAVPSYTLSGTADVDYGILPDSDELLEGYLQQQMYGGISFYGTTAGDRLKGNEKFIYDELKDELIQVASGKNTSTVFSIDLEDQLLSWTAEDLGVTEVIRDGALTEEADIAINKKLSDALNLSLLLNCLLTDCPYELYWFDKTNEYAIQLEYGMLGNSTQISINNFTFYFMVSDDYMGDDCFTADKSKTSAASKAVEKANVIVEEYADKTDLEKLDAYRAEICSLVSYNEAAANDGVSYGDPWQLIYVFDGDPDTNVVCEGYAKAFQYLCDLSEFTGDVVCNTVTGIMNGGTGAGDHMWNVVEYGGKYYLVDITNCDTGTIGADTELFMAGTDSTDGDRTYTFTIGTSQIVYEYDEDQENLICDGYPVLSDSSLSSDKSNIYSGTCGENAKWSLDTNTGVLTVSGSVDMYDYSDTNKAPWDSQKDSIKSVYIENGITTIGNEAFYDCSNLTSITIPASVTQIGDNAFYKCTKLTIKCYKNSAAYNYAVANNIPYVLIKDSAAAPKAPKVAGKTTKTVTLTKENGCEYSKDGKTWQTSNVFTGLTAETEYTFYQRIAETDTSYASAASVATKVKTMPKESLVNEKGVWYYTENDQKINTTTLVNYYGVWYYVEKGKVNWKCDTLCKYGGKYYYVKNGKVDWSCNTLCNYYGIYYYVKNGQVDWSCNTLCNYYGIYYYVKNGQVDWKCDTLCNYGGTYYYVKNGKVDWNCNTLCKYGNTWYYVQKGKVNWNATTLCNYGGTWYYVEKGKVNFNATTLCNYGGTWYYVEKGKVNFSATTLCKYGNTWYYVEKGKVNFKANLSFKYYGKYYNVRNGVVKF